MLTIEATPQHTATAHQFVADFFSNHNQNFDYSYYGVCWNGWVGWIANAGVALEEAIRLASPNRDRPYQFDFWYDVLEEATKVYAEHVKNSPYSAGEPSTQCLLNLFRPVIVKHIADDNAGQ